MSPARPAHAALPWYQTVTVMIIAGCLVAIVNFGVRSTFGFFTLPISEAHGWPREIFSFAIAIQNLVWGIATPVAGMLADRYGSARVLMAGAIVYAIGVLLMSVTATPVMFNLAGGLLVGVGIAFSSFSIVMAALGRIVPPDRRSWAFGIATASGSLGQFIFAPLGAMLVSAYGWQQALTVLAGLTLLIVLFAAPLLSQNTSGRRPTADEADLTMKAAIGLAFGHRSYILLVSGFFVCGFQLAFITVHMPAYLAEHGISREFAGWAMALIGLFNVVGSYVSGIIGGRGEKHVPLAFIYLIRAVITAGFVLLPVTQVTTLIFTCSMGLLWLSTVPLTMGLVTVMFGTRYMATLYGFVFVSHQLGSFLGVWLAGRLYDQFGSYDIVWWMSVGLGVFAFLVNLPIREQRAPRFAAA
ncbi:MAG: MFS transporter [Aestuariivirga sp.]|uniref:MFS transporter n=1 Tax=Aestuariivirga sp. TaxID=2650926 RepID=UPI00301771A8